MTSNNFPLPPHEEARIKALRAIGIVGSSQEPEFDAVVQVVQATFGVPIALISFVEADRQWFKAKCGLDAEDTPREAAFCAHTITGQDVMIVPDTFEDRRFADNPLVTGEPFIRFYAGCPLSIDGKHNIGTLCVIDQKPREPLPAEIDQLRRMAKVTEGLVRAYKAAADLEAAAHSNKNQHDELAAQHRLLKQIEQMAEVGAFKIDWDTGETSWSDQIFRLHDLPIGASPSLEEAVEFFPGDERQRVVDQFKKDFALGRATYVEADFVTALGRKRRVRFSGELQSGEGGKQTVLGVMQDVTRQYQDAQTLWRAAHIDGLSGLANRKWFHERLNADLRKGASAPGGLGLILIDLDGFKLVNDSLGHAAGDRVIRVMADRMQAHAGADVFCARLAGDEFAMLVPTAANMRDTVDGLRVLTDGLIEALKQPVIYGQERLYIGASIGIARAPHDAERPEDLMRCADMALYKAKRSGRGRTMFYHEGLKNIFSVRRAAIDRVRDAFHEQRIEAHYQPIIDSRTRIRLGAEALVRIRMPDSTLFGPDDFKPAFDDPESARIIDKCVFETVLSHMSGWQAEGGNPGIISLNISDHWFQSDRFADQTLACLEDAGIDPGSIRFEIGETTLLNEDLQIVQQQLERLSKAGLSVALDDFGAGFASLTHLRDFPIDTIKIDRSFVRGLGQHEPSTLIVKAIIDLARSLELNVVATGVETEQEADCLRDLGCFNVQGVLFGNAVSADAIAARLKTADSG
ncbi:hypothetical protein GCM10011316_22520 [Roseibium aquae]|uniref:Diguanylate cyclase (GGDEF)-like protein n=1 Tax=Roseibium aquae TaxID=1323746 RepID=A0A916TJV8_9HYPH|nr:EAL domain-containing protein [Roseibium aquae]GGB49904.1 hypothetical protein GCM10011316_22520 [Roseibium aquae]